MGCGCGKRKKAGDAKQVVVAAQRPAVWNGKAKAEKADG